MCVSLSNTDRDRGKKKEPKRRGREEERKERNWGRRNKRQVSPIVTCCSFDLNLPWTPTLKAWYWPMVSPGGGGAFKSQPRSLGMHPWRGLKDLLPPLLSFDSLATPTLVFCLPQFRKQQERHQETLHCRFFQSYEPKQDVPSEFYNSHCVWSSQLQC